MSTSDTETTFSHVEALRTIGEAFPDRWIVDVAEDALDRNYAEYVSDLLRFGHEGEQVDVLHTARAIIDHHESRLRRELFGEAVPDRNKSNKSLFEQAVELGALIEQLKDRYMSAVHFGNPDLLDEAEAYVDHAAQYWQEVMAPVGEHITKLFTETTTPEKVAWYVERFRSRS